MFSFLFKKKQKKTKTKKRDYIFSNQIEHAIKIMAI